MPIYQFRNKIKNTQIWPRCFVAFSLSEAKTHAKEFEIRMNIANGYQPHLLFTFDYDNVTIIETEQNFNEEGYIEL